ncbi:MAG: Ig-like domain-containing protein [Anaerovoracaceae bacterium]
MKITKKLLSIILAVSLVLGIAFVSPNYASAASPKINKTKVTLDIGQKTKLKVENTKSKPKWTTSNKKIVVVSKTGTIRAIKAGKATVYAKIGKSKYKSSITVRQAKGTRTNPFNASTGAKIKTSDGTMYFKVTDIMKNAEAVSFMSANNEWNSFNEYEISNHPNDNLFILQYYVSAVEGYNKQPLSGYSIFNQFDTIYNSDCTHTINSFDSMYFTNGLESKSYSSFEIFNKTSGVMYVPIFVPKNINSFAYTIYNDHYDNVWVKYNL